MKRFHSITNRDYQKLRWSINSIAYKLGGKLGRNPTFDERGLTDELFDMLQMYFTHIKLSRYFINLSAKKPSEKNTGADILFRIINNRQEISFDRYVLIQAKKYIASNGQFSETNVGNTHLSGQVARMHNFNPEFSYIMLYSTNESPSGNIVLGNSHANSDVLLDFYSDVGEFVLSRQFQNCVNIQDNYPVTFIRSKTWEKFSTISAENLLNYSETLPNFLLDDLVTGKIGKEWDNSIEKAQGEFSIVITLSIGQG